MYSRRLLGGCHFLEKALRVHSHRWSKRERELLWVVSKSSVRLKVGSEKRDWKSSFRFSLSNCLRALPFFGADSSRIAVLA